MENSVSYEEVQFTAEDGYIGIRWNQMEKPRAVTNNRTRTRSVILFSVMFIILLLAVTITMTILYLRQSKQLEQAQEELNTLTKSGTNHQLQLKRAELEITELKNLLQSKQLEQAQEKLKNLTKQEELEITELKRKQSECCPEDWKIFDHGCYHVFSSSYNWSDAQKQCDENQSYLVMINNAGEQNFIKNTIKNDETWYWIGLTDIEKEGEWKWVDGKPCKCTGENKLYWHDKEPDNWTSKTMEGSTEDEDCALISPDGKWSDARCRNPNGWICEKLTSAC